MYVPPIIIGVIVSSMAAYGFAKMEFIGKNTIFAILMSSLTLPNSVGMIAAIIMYNSLGWMGTPLPLMVPKMMGSIGIVFFLRQFYMGLPDDLIGAARVDGLGDYGIFLRVALPLSLPALGSQFILTFIGAYNDYLGPLYYLIGNPELYPLQLSLAYWRTGSNPDWAILMAGAVTATIPMVCLYLVSQKFILKGVAITSGLKG
jgi:multiple sugar transport system permease protein